MPNIDIDRFVEHLKLTQGEMVALAALLDAGWVVRYPIDDKGQLDTMSKTMIVLVKEDQFHDFLNNLGDKL